MRVLSVCGTAADAVVVISPSAVHRVRTAVTMAVHNFMTVFWAMAPHFRVGRFAYFPHDVYGGSEITDRRPWRVDLRMNTTRMGARGSEGPRGPAGARRCLPTAAGMRRAVGAADGVRPPGPVACARCGGPV